MRERVAIIADNSLSYLNKILELWNADNIPVLIDYRIPINGCISLIDKAKVKVIYTDRKELCNHIHEYRSDLQVNILVPDKELLNKLTQNIRNKYRKRYDETEALVLFSSGTTGEGKGIKLSHKAITINADLIAGIKKVDRKSVFYLYKTISHCATFVGELMVSLITGAEVYISTSRQIMKKNIMNINKYGVTHFSVNPTVLQMIMSQEKKFYSFPTLKLVVCSGSLFTVGCRAMAQKFFGCPVINMYGMTEVTALAVSQAPLMKETIGTPSQPESVGKPLCGIRVKILDSFLRKVNIGEIGNIFIATPTIMMGYIGEDSIELDKSGYWDTGDVGYIDENDELIVVGRRDRMIITSGHNVFPESIERLIKVSGLVDDCYVMGVQDPIYGEKIVCVYCCNIDKRDIVKKEIQHMCLENLASYELPQCYVWNEKMEYTSSGKIICNKWPGNLQV